jgi:heptosyltransferase-2
VSEPRHILVCRLSALGDIVLTLPALHALRLRFPDASLETLSKAPLHRILEAVPDVDERHGWAGKGAPLPDTVRERSWDLVVNLSGSGRSRRLLSGLRAQRRLRVRKQAVRRFAFVHLRVLGFDGSGLVPAVERNLETLAPLGVSPVEPRPRFAGTSPTPGGPVILAPGAGRPTKRWPAERFAEVARRVGAELDRDVHVLGPPAERELLEAVAGGAGPRARTVVCDDPARLPELVSAGSLALANDSGLLHVAEACGLPVIALFGPTHPALGFAPRDPRSRCLRTGIACSPCDLHGPKRCPRGHHRCLQDLDTGTVVDAILSVAGGGR